ncbi:type III secretion system effector VopR [Vibrio parahaemolyticus]|uniref:type III secretion system effector VopR n=1 Tax=Vibrio parahaemolyticus TaxID=670 RepID=UPI001037DA5D|nr:type III secretion system effector VopR [Vibrio parahaemolyticus]MDA0389429.1 type III secretion system effector VopR [Vibrio parahaemolyticus]MDA0393909.1 type III secretion system effector VopR [Vibrio parahaemolyticus]MDA0398658.1 type III secretion system effector VopR [Vibrio parahaemolyticus]MDA0403090.1 type III secretion system effector VopR [Vibrio parahaemolyticus]TBT06465.1 hypothetical protein D5E87_10170 [Vibrio parahaemolyticus]
MVNINTSHMQSLRQLTSHLATQNQADDKEIRAHNGKDIFVKEGAPKNKSVSARISHQNKAKDIVVNLLTKQGIPKEVAKQMLQNVLNGENKLTLGNLKNLERLSSGPSSHWPAAQTDTSSSKTSKASSSVALINEHKDYFQKLGDFACTDLNTFGQKGSQFYETKGAPRLKALYANQARIAQDQRATMSASAVQAAAQRGNAPQLSTLQNIAKYVQNAKAGCCTTFAFAAAAEMIQGMSGTPENQPKVEVVAFKKGHSGTHLYVLVGRQEGSDIKDPSTWNKDVKIVDPWAASAFGATMFGDAQRPPVSNMFPPTEVIFDSHKLG